MKPKKYRLLHEDEIILPTDQYTYHYQDIDHLRRGAAWVYVGNNPGGRTIAGKTRKECLTDRPCDNESTYQIRREWKHGI